MAPKKEMTANKITMQSLVLCPMLVVTKDPKHASGVNIATISYVSVISELPAMIGLAVRPTRDTHRLLTTTGEFTLNLPAPDMLKALDFCGSRSGRQIDKASVLELALEDADKISTPRLENSPLVLECKVIKSLDHSRSRQATHDFFMADVLGAYHREDFRLDRQPSIVTTNFNYRLVETTLGQAFRVWKRGG
jgi:flavin reductase (DIM6/NTAB) family NADH-FMN oxidoreductase RutF